MICCIASSTVVEVKTIIEVDAGTLTTRKLNFVSVSFFMGLFLLWSVLAPASSTPIQNPVNCPAHILEAGQRVSKELSWPQRLYFSARDGSMDASVAKIIRTVLASCPDVENCSVDDFQIALQKAFENEWQKLLAIPGRAAVVSIYGGILAGVPILTYYASSLLPENMRGLSVPLTIVSGILGALFLRVDEGPFVPRFKSLFQRWLFRLWQFNGQNIWGMSLTEYPAIRILENAAVSNCTGFLGPHFDRAYHTFCERGDVAGRQAAIEGIATAVADYYERFRHISPDAPSLLRNFRSRFIYRVRAYDPEFDSRAFKKDVLEWIFEKASPDERLIIDHNGNGNGNSDQARQLVEKALDLWLDIRHAPTTVGLSR